MKEYIEREAVIKIILGQPPEPHYPEWYYRDVKEIPAADVVEVVRCKDCKHYRTSGCTMDAYAFDVVEEGYCSYGERKEV